MPSPGHNSLEEVQADLDAFMSEYNTKRTNEGKRCLGKTPMETLEAGRELCDRYIPGEVSAA